jgi:hypothetical protein
MPVRTMVKLGCFAAAILLFFIGAFVDSSFDWMFAIGLALVAVGFLTDATAGPGGVAGNMLKSVILIVAIVLFFIGAFVDNWNLLLGLGLAILAFYLVMDQMLTVRYAGGRFTGGSAPPAP